MDASYAREVDSPPPSRALVVEGGGLRGAFSAGALAEIAARGPAFDDIFAVSSGAPTAAYMIAAQIDEGLRVWQQHSHGDQLISPKNLLRARPLLDVDRLLGVFERGVPLDRARLEGAATRLWIVVTNCATGRAEYVRATAENVLPLLRATMALPIAYGKIVPVGGAEYVDGGVSDSIPLARAMTLARDRTAVILTRPRGYRRGKGAVGAYLMGRTYPRHPAVGAALLARSAVSNASLDLVDALEERGEIDVIRPARPLPAGRLDTSKERILETIEIGRAAARAWLAKPASRRV